MEYIKKLKLHHGKYYWTYDGGLKSNDGPTMIYLWFKIIIPDTKIDVSILKYYIEKATLAKFGNNVTYIFDNMSSNYSIII